MPNPSDSVLNWAANAIADTFWMSHALGPHLKMENSTGSEESKTIRFLLCTSRSSGSHWVSLSVANFFFSLTAFVGNTLILVAINKDTSLHPPSKLLYRCLATTDLLVGLIAQPSIGLYFTFLVTGHRLTDLCFYTAVIGTFSFTILTAVSLQTMTAISVDRLLALLLGVRYRHIVTLRRVRALVILFWISSIAFASMSFLKYTIPKSYNYTLISLCILISVFCFSKIFRVLRHQQAQVTGHTQGERTKGAESSLNEARYKKTVYTAMWVEVILVACYLPYGLTTPVIVSLGSSTLRNVLWAYSATLVLVNSSLNPIIYCWKIIGVRQEVKKTVGQLLCLSS